MTHPATRRTVLLAAGAAGAAALTTGCGGGGDDGSAPETGTAPEATDATDAPPGQELASTGEIPVGGGKVFKGEKVVVTQPAEGDFKAFSAVCTHQNCVVATVSDGTIHCTCHNSRFRIADGSVAHGPASRPLPEKRITVEGNSIRLA
ncbi:Rieske (2Fe-2S) protein [Streptomyces sp. NPDC005931]|uniref:Rieske (2Fe-2S) protein n=1 Tax=Streptomyces sp. NPDC005931 TaxID=3364737 RepID=UPI0036823900